MIRALLERRYLPSLTYRGYPGAAAADLTVREEEPPTEAILQLIVDAGGRRHSLPPFGICERASDAAQGTTAESVVAYEPISSGWLVRACRCVNPGSI